MRLVEEHKAAIRRLVQEEAGDAAKVCVFGSRLNDACRGGDLDLLIELPQEVDNPAWLAARIEARAARVLNGRSVDVLLVAPNLRQLPIHQAALRRGVQL